MPSRPTPSARESPTSSSSTSTASARRWTWEPKHESQVAVPRAVRPRHRAPVLPVPAIPAAAWPGAGGFPRSAAGHAHQQVLRARRPGVGGGPLGLHRRRGQSKRGEAPLAARCGVAYRRRVPGAAPGPLPAREASGGGSHLKVTVRRMQDARLLGTWRSDKRRTRLEILARRDIRGGKGRTRLIDIFGKLTLRYTRTRCYSTFEGSIDVRPLR